MKVDNCRDSVRLRDMKTTAQQVTKEILGVGGVHGADSVRRFRVEGHGDSLVMIGGVRGSWGYHQDPYLSREDAWKVAKELMASGKYHTVKVYELGKGNGAPVWQGFKFLGWKAA